MSGGVRAPRGRYLPVAEHGMFATGALGGTSASATNRLLSTVAGAVIGLLATVLIPVPGRDRE